MENEECEKIIDIFKKAGMRINIGENYSVKGQVAQLINGVKELYTEWCIANAPKEEISDAEDEAWDNE